MAVTRLQARDRIEHATLIAYQTVKCWALTKGKKRMPTFESLLPKDKNAVATPQQLKGALMVLSGQFGGRVRKGRR